jgi:hypothetical protein
VEVVAEALPAPPPPEPEPAPEPLPAEPRGSLFEDLDDEDVSMVVAAVSDPIQDVIPPLDSDLTPDEKAEFIKLLNAEMPIASRAHQLGILARKTGQKTAAVGLRAIIEINEITGLRKERATESAPMFALPAGSSVSVSITKVVK